MNLKEEQALSTDLEVASNHLLQNLLLQKLSMHNSIQPTWELIVPMVDTELVKYNGATLNFFFQKDALFYEKISNDVRVESNLHRAFNRGLKIVDDEDEISSEYGEGISDEIRQIIEAANRGNEELKEDYIPINLFITGSVKRSDICAIQCNAIVEGLYRITIASVASDIILHVDNEEQAMLISGILEAYRDYDNFMEVASRLTLELLEQNQDD